MRSKKLLSKFNNEITNNNLLTDFFNDIFEYRYLKEYNYIYRYTEEKDKIIIDIYDNISNNRFNRYIFLFNSNLDNRVEEDNNVFITYINTNKPPKDNSNISKLAYLITLDNNQIEYAKTFLDQKYLDILTKIIK